MKVPTHSTSVFLFDASVLIPILAEGYTGHTAALALLRMLNETGAAAVTSDYFVEEVAEHLRWAIKLVTKFGDHSSEVLDCISGNRGYRSNLFLEGFVKCASDGQVGSFADYLHRILRPGTGPSDIQNQVQNALKMAGIPALKLDQWEGFRPSLFSDRDLIQKEIFSLREMHGTYKHDRQTKAEAEAALLVQRTRDGSLTWRGQKRHGYFISHTRIIDGLAGLPTRVVILPEGLMQWLLACQKVSEEDANALFKQLIAACAADGLEFASTDVILSVFTGVIEASKNKLHSIVEGHRTVRENKYGPDPSRAFDEGNPFDFPFLAKAHEKDKLENLQKLLEVQQRRAELAERSARLEGNQVVDYQRLKAKQKQKKEKAQKRRRSAESKNKK